MHRALSLILIASVVAGCSGTAAPPAATAASAAPAPAAAPSQPSPEAAAPALVYPETRREAIVDTIHGVPVGDPYRWLEDGKAEEVQRWMAAESAVARGYLDRLPGRQQLTDRLHELMYYDAISAPMKRKERLFYTRRHADKEKQIVYWRQGERGEERVLLDPNQWSRDGSLSLGGYWPSWDGRYVAYKVKQNNADEATMHVLEVATGETLADTIPGAKYGVASWLPDGKGFYYTSLPVDPTIPVADRPGFADVRLHLLGTETAKDTIVHERTGNPQKFVSSEVTRDGHWLFVTLSSYVADEVYVRDLRRPKSKFQPLVAGVAAKLTVAAWQDRFYVMTNDGAPRFRILRVDPKKLDRAHWKEIVPETEAKLDSFAIVGGRLALEYMKDASTALELRSLEGAPVRQVPLPGIGSSDGLQGLEDDDDAYFGFSSFASPKIIYRTSIASGAVEEWARVKLPIDPSKIVVDQVWYPSRDGTKISMFLIHNADAVKNGKNPTLLNGYGGFRSSMTPFFSAPVVLWLEQGGVYAIPNLRGGGEYGEDWHKAGMLLAKQNVFDDFIAAASYLVAEGWTSSEHLAVYGASNGGLLVGAVMTQAPQLYKAVVCGVPLLDMIRYHRFGSGETWVSEYGSADDADQFRALLAYSPYHHVVDGTKYPALLMLSADSDDRVDPMHARKFTAAVQHASSSAAPALLRIEARAGHGGADMVKQSIDQYTDMYAFLLDQLSGHGSN